MAPQNIIDAAGNFNWDYLKGSDLPYPAPEHFRVTHVYHRGSVVRSAATAGEIHALCVSLGLKSVDAPASLHRDTNLLTEQKYVVEAETREDEFLVARNLYHAEVAKREALFMKTLIAREGLEDNPKAELCYSKAYERSHSQGFPEVVNTFIDMAELIR